MKAMILAAGFGKRLQPLTHTTPKPLLKVAGKPIIQHIINHLKSTGIIQIVINLHHLGEQIQKALGDGKQWGVEIQYSWEDQILGTGGGIKKAQSLLGNEPFVLYNGDILSDVDLRQVIQFHQHHDVIATLVVRPNPNPETIGIVRVQDERVVDLRETIGITTEPAYMYTGIQICDPVIFDYLRPEFSDVITDFHLSVLRHHQNIGAFDHHGYWSDCGTHDDLTLARKTWNPSSRFQTGNDIT